LALISVGLWALIFGVLGLWTLLATQRESSCSIDGIFWFPAHHVDDGFYCLSKDAPIVSKFIVKFIVAMRLLYAQ